MCGTYEWEWDEDRYAYRAAMRTCQGCVVLDASREDFKSPPGTRMVLIPKDKAQEIEARGFGGPRR